MGRHSKFQKLRKARKAVYSFGDIRIKKMFYGSQIPLLRMLIQIIEEILLLKA